MLKKSCIIIFILSLLVAGGCARKTMILSEPQGAQVVVNGKEVCTTPCSIDYKTGSFGESYQILLEKDGYDPVLYRMKANEVDNKARKKLWTAGLFIPGGSVLWVGSLFTNRLKESYHFVLREEQTMVAITGQGSGE